jgi:hypothetical protein
MARHQNAHLTDTDHANFHSAPLNPYKVLLCIDLLNAASRAQSSLRSVAILET